MTDLKSCTTLPTVVSGNNFLSSSLIFCEVLQRWLLIISSSKSVFLELLLLLSLIKLTVVDTMCWCWGWYWDEPNYARSCAAGGWDYWGWLQHCLHWWQSSIASQLLQILQTLCKLMWLSLCYDEDWVPRMRSDYLSAIVNSLSGYQKCKVGLLKVQRLDGWLMRLYYVPAWWK